MDGELSEHHRSLRRVYGLACIAWPPFLVLDLVQATSSEELAQLMIGRGAATALFVAGWLALRRLQRPTWAVINAFEAAATLGLTATTALMDFANPLVGAVGPSGLSFAILVYSAVIRAHWRRVIVFTGAMTLLYISILVIGRAETLRSEVLGKVFLSGYLFVVASAILGATVSHMLWSARKQVYEARKLGRYRLKSRIGRGGMGQIWLARDESNDRDVALKILDATAADRAGALARFEREARMASSLQSPHTVRVFDFGGSDDGVWYMAMELLEGGDLGTYVGRQGPLPPVRALDLGRQACESLREAHAAGIIHRDIKPENLFLTSSVEGTDFLKVVDFGIAKQVLRADDDATLTQQGWIGGTPAYMAPEICSGGVADPRSDIYSLGAVLYFMLTGTPPFEVDTPGGLMRAHVEQPPELLSVRLGRKLPRDLEIIVLRCLAKRAEERPQSAADLASALEAIADNTD